MSQKQIEDAKDAIEKALLELAAMQDLAASGRINAEFAKLKVCRAELEVKSKRAKLTELLKKKG